VRLLAIKPCEPSKDVKQTALFACTLAAFLTPFLSSAANIALPAIGAEFSMDTATLGWVQASFLLSSAVLLLPFGRAADIWGRKKVFSGGLLIFAIFSLVAPFSSSTEMLLATRVLQGVGGAMLYGTAAAILTSTFPPQQRGKVLGIFTAGIYTGLSLGPVAGGFLVQNFGWRSVFLSNVPIAAIALLFAVLKLKEEWADAKGSRFDTIGTMIYVVSLSLIMLGASYISSGMNASTWAGINSGSIVMMSIGLFLMLGFVLWELKSGSPLLDVRLFKNNKVFAASNLSALINYGATYALSLLLSLYLQLVKGFSPQFSGFILLAQPIVQTVLSPLAGSMSDRVSPRLVTSLGMALNAVGLLFFGFIDAATDITLIATYLVIMGIGFALFSSPNTNALMGCVEKNCLGVASATLATMRSLGMIVSTVVAINVLTLFIGYVVISSAPISLLMGGIRESFLVFAILCFIGVAISVLGLRKQNSKQ